MIECPYFNAPFALIHLFFQSTCMTFVAYAHTQLAQPGCVRTSYERAFKLRKVRLRRLKSFVHFGYLLSINIHSLFPLERRVLPARGV